MSTTNESDDYRRFNQFLQDACGILLGENKAYLVNSRIKSILSKYALRDLGHLIQELNSFSNRQLKEDVVDAMTTNETLWFRDNHPFHLLATKLFPMYSQKSSFAPVKIWSAACSTGQEPYSIAITAKEYQDAHPGQLKAGVNVMATDISQTVLNMARSGVYEMLALGRGMSQERLSHCFDLHEQGKWKIKPVYQKMVNFQLLNLMESYHKVGSDLDIIFCRNVLIYFSADLKKQILIKMHQCLKPGGYLLLGASESLNGLSEYYEMEQCKPGIIYKAKSKS